MRFSLAALAMAVAIAFPAGATASKPSVECGTKVLYGKRYEIHVVGNPLPCEQVREIIRGHCRETKEWSCFSFWPPAPALVWFREEERFAADWSTAIEARRYPCSKARVTKHEWRAATRSHSSQFPGEDQLLADDIVRCNLLAGMSYRRVRQLLGHGDSYTYKGHRQLSYDLGPERDSFFQLDDEFLTVLFRGGKARRAELGQG